MILSPSSGCVSISCRSSSVSGPGFSSTEFGIPILPMSWKSAPSSSRFSVSPSRPSSRPTRSAVSVIQRAWEDVYSSRASSAFASASTVERNVRSSPSKLDAFAIASFAWWARPPSELELAVAELDVGRSATAIAPQRPSIVKRGDHVRAGAAGRRIAERGVLLRA